MKKTKNDVYRQGDVLMIRRVGLGKGSKIDRERGRVVLAHGEISGHSHAIADKAAALYQPTDADLIEAGSRVLSVTKAVTITHEEHAPIKLGRGLYEIKIQCEYSPAEFRRVED